MTEYRSAAYYCDLMEMEDPILLQKAREEFEITAAEGYDCPIDDKVEITIG